MMSVTHVLKSAKVNSLLILRMSILRYLLPQTRKWH